MPSKRELGYRNKLEFSTGYDQQGKFALGLHEHGGTFIPIPKQCLLGAKGIEKAPGALRGALAYLQGSTDLGIFRIGIRRSVRTQDTEIALWTKPCAFPRKIVADTCKALLNAQVLFALLPMPESTQGKKG